MTCTKQKTKTEVLAIAIPLFANGGYDGVTMRQIAAAVGIKAASLYYHFPDKQTLYIDALGFAFAERIKPLSEAFTLAAEPQERLRMLLDKFCILMAEDVDFARLIEREIMHGDATRLQFLADHVFTEFVRDMMDLGRALAPHRDPHLLAISVVALVVYHFQITPLRSFLPGFKKSHNDPGVVARHIFSLLESGLFARPASLGNRDVIRDRNSSDYLVR
ncbi:MAG: TetR/AcrR family transcriptional regulator [Deltaproteobacteria bacterium CG_4_10_14_3_um_filter_60_8]|nr:MAG: TetR family transcriptional regulator [Deltaproteobacteria bacterium CG23_combo_of_CG06-09_8_20_14_all_60_8]PIY21764.1 MAG: TetR/AcrR family transcriptional regulator [Deltaproteobacteria bacterium CG_4_10_14_3_um_filter_60_8]